MEKNILYSNNCVKCKILKEILDKNKIDYELETDEDKMKSLGFDFMPVLKYEGDLYSFKEALDLLSGGSSDVSR